MIDVSAPEMAYFVGLLQTDGTHEGNLDGRGRITVELAARDASVLYQLQGTIPWYCSIGHRTRRTNFTGSRAAAYETASLRLYNQEARRELAGLGVPTGKKSHTIAPPRVESLHTSAYVRGLLDGDGSVGFTAAGSPFVSLVTASEAIAEFFCACILEVCGVVRTPGRNARDKVFNVMVLNVAAVKLAAWAWGSEPGIGIERKWLAASEVQSWAPAPGREGRYGIQRRSWTPEDDHAVLSLGQKDAAATLGRSVSSVSARKWRLTHDI